MVSVQGDWNCCRFPRDHWISGVLSSGLDFRIRLILGSGSVWFLEQDQVLSTVWTVSLRTGSGAFQFGLDGFSKDRIRCFSVWIGLVHSRDKKKVKLTDIGFRFGNSNGYWIKELWSDLGYCF